MKDNKDGIIFDVTKITAGELADMIAADEAGNLQRLAKHYAAACSALPKAWGEPSVAFFENMTQPQYLRVAKAWNETASAAIIAVYETGGEMPDGVTYDLHNVKAADMMRLRRAFNQGNVGPCAAHLTKIVTGCPWGDPSEVKTFQKLPYYGVFTPFVRALINDAYDTEKN